jgi:UDP-N-acetyl-D-mannosaminuronic acid dehydrogenase
MLERSVEFIEKVDTLLGDYFHQTRCDLMKHRIAIVGGCGHAGLPLGLAFAARGQTVTLLDIDAKKVDIVNSGQMPFLEEGADLVLRRVIGQGLNATLDKSCLQDADTVIAVVGTPVGQHLNPAIMEVYRSIEALLDDMKDGTLLVLRSTVYPGTTKLVYERVLTLGRNLPVAFCPERIAEGKAMRELFELPQIVASFTSDGQKAAGEVFGILGVEIIPLEPLEAELAKLFTNSWRYLNFAISNQFYLLTQSYGLDFNRIHDAMTRNYPRMRAFARAGFAAGPCLLKDTLQLSAFSGNSFFLGHAAMLINEGLPNFIVTQLRRQGLSGKRVALLGMAFKGDSDDGRESLSYKLRNLLEVEAKEVFCTDPYVPNPSWVPLDEAIARADIIVLGAPHKVYRDLQFAPDKTVIDIWGFWQRVPATIAAGEHPTA